MKLKYFSLALMLFVGTSCNDSFLDKIPQDQLSDESFWKVEEDAVKYTTSIYRYFPEPGNYIIMTDCYTDNALPVHVFTNQGDISSGAATASTGHFKELWQILYRGIRRCNIFFENIDKVAMKEDKRNVLIGEVEFLRAYFHATLLKYYGGIPILTYSLKLNEPIPTRNTEEEVYDFVMKECDKAISKLPLTRKESSEVGRINKGAAIALKAHLSYLMKKYDNAISATKEIINLGVYDLFENYERLFSAESENNCEVILDIQFMDNAKDYIIGSWIDQYFSPGMMGGWEDMSPTQDMVDEYECIDGKTIHESALYNPNNQFENRDPRLAYSILWHGCEFGGQIYSTKDVMGNGNATRTGYAMRKYIDPGNKGNEYPGRINYILFRYTEMLLIYAEMQNELHGPDQTVYAAVDRIRARVNMPPLPSGLNKDQMRTAIRHERRVEFIFEGLHMFETRSWRTTEACVKKPVYGMTYDGKKVWIETRNFNPDKNYLWAIPLTEIDLSKGTLKQNPGY